MRWINFIKNTEDIEKGLKIKMKGKQGKRLGLVILAIVLVFVFSAMILASSFLLYATEGIDAELDLDMLVANQGRTTKLYYYDGEGKAIELENERALDEKQLAEYEEQGKDENDGLGTREKID